MFEECEEVRDNSEDFIRNAEELRRLPQRATGPVELNSYAQQNPRGIIFFNGRFVSSDGFHMLDH
jgi:hypothetical protein